MFTALDLRNDVCTYHEYMSQFVNDRILDIVRNRFGIELLLSSDDPHFNDIPLLQWDRLDILIQNSIDRKLYMKCHNATYGERDQDKFIWSLSQGVSIAKTAARILVENAKN